MSKNLRSIFPMTLALGVVTLTGWAQQPAQREAAPNPESGWRKFNQDGAVRQVDPQPMGALVLPAGTWITIRVNDVISTNHNVAGDAFTATLANPVIAEGIVVARRGQMMGGRVAESVKGGKTTGVSRLGLELTEMSLADGRQVPVKTQLINYSAGTSKGRDATAVAATTGTGAAIGAMAGGGVGAGIGALAGATAGAIGVLVTRGKTTEVYPEAVMTFRLLEPMVVATDRAAAGTYRPAGQQDYESRLVDRPQVQVAQPSPVYVGVGLGYGWGWPYYYGSYWYGPGYRYYGGPRYYGGYRYGHR